MMDFYYFEKLERMQRRIHRKFLSEWNAISPMKLTIHQAIVLQTLARGGLHTVTELADIVCISCGGLTILCDKLEEKGLVVRVRDETDRRLVNMQITDQGRKLVQSIVGLKGELVERMLDGLSTQDMSTLDSIYTKVLRNLGEQNGQA
ncbi:MarR family winged helix-turn-helix transcriptional regulator [Paenibacillus thalictri]|uniref:MarR family transcriptional regulator n=1 Tax=Paenibacillus thalictri TaxID=2527873 RepID=A0A4Q9DVK1_9BACL|nr:MarR family transcriptional regulator [Paenibacillus thalictri]TBL80000.1 MarR family transcriptional regulator [Paenibacillus thalictri]